MITAREEKIYDWEDIQKEIEIIVKVKSMIYWFSKKTNKPCKFDDPDVEYRDFWHVALDTFIGSEVHNDSIITLFNLEDKDEWVEKFGEWTRPYFHAYFQIMNELDPKNNGILVSFSW
jgi:hypothetical protein